MPTRIERYRLKAEECLALAGAMSDRDLARDMRDLARQWLQLTDDAELLDGRNVDRDS